MPDAPPRLGFLGVGWIGRQRMEAAKQSGVAEIGAVADVNAETAAAAAAGVGCSEVCTNLNELLACPLDGVVVATPTALHANQAAQVLERGLPVFCQKPLGLTARECRQLVEQARRVGVALGADMSYRYTSAVQAGLVALRSGAIGQPHAAELVFHNAYGPDKAWANDVELAGGGALIDLGCHLLDLARAFMGELSPRETHADLFAAGQPLGPDPREPEDLAMAQVTLVDGRSLRIACSWWLPTGQDAVIEASFTGPGGAIKMRNIGGSFYDFEALLIKDRQVTRLAEPPDAWGGRALIQWAAKLGSDRSFDPEVESLVEVAELIDQIYGRKR